jgi:hypothetical protein
MFENFLWVWMLAYMQGNCDSYIYTDVSRG